jgi:membrane protein
MKSFFNLVRRTYSEWSDDHAPRLAAAMAYYTLFSIAPVLVIAIAVAGLAFGREAVEGQLYGQLRGFVGDTGAQAIQGLVASASRPSAGILATLLGVGTLLLGAAGVFGQLQEALNTIWGVRPRPGLGIWSMLRQRSLSFSMVLGTGFLLLVSLVLSAVLAAISEYFQGAVPGFDTLWSVVNYAVSFLITLLLFALIYKVVPDAQIAWRDVWVGALMTTVLFSIGRFALAEYLGRSSFGSTYGAGAALIIILLWVNYSAQIMFFGAEFTQVYAHARGRDIRPAPYAEAVGAGQADQPGEAGSKPHVKAVQATIARDAGSPPPQPARHTRRGASRASSSQAVAPEPGMLSVTAMAAGFIVGLFVGRRGSH